MNVVRYALWLCWDLLKLAVGIIFGFARMALGLLAALVIRFL